MTISFDKVDWYKKLTEAGVDAACLVGKAKPCPVCGGKDRFRFDNKNNAGTFWCQQCGPGNGFTLLQKLGWTSPEIMRFLDDGTVAKTDGPIMHAPLQDKEFSPENVAKNRKQLQHAWSTALPLTGADPASRYLQMRVPGCDVSRLSSSLRFHRGMQYWEADEKGKFHKRGYFPVLLGRAVDGANNPITCHRTYLSRDGKKAPFENVKKQMKGVRKLDGAAIRVVTVPDSRVLGLAEGIENAVAVATASRYRFNIWSLVNCQNLEVADIPKGMFDKVIIYADHDKLDPKHNRRPGEHHARLLKARLEQAGFEVELKIPPVEGTDFADMWVEIYTARLAAKQQESHEQQASRSEDRRGVSVGRNDVPGALLGTQIRSTGHALRQ